MHWVDRGYEPSGLGQIREHYTPEWIEFYRNGFGIKPKDSRWRDFREELGQRFLMHCGYCEFTCRGEVDHFRPKSRFPEVVYDWSNWIFACHDCNQAKGDKWPVVGYVDPCTVTGSDSPETYFTFDTESGEIVPLKGLDPDRLDKVKTMIDDLKLNDLHHLEKRGALLCKMAEIIPGDPSMETSVSRGLRRILVSRNSELSSLARAWLVERGYEISD